MLIAVSVEDVAAGPKELVARMRQGAEQELAKAREYHASLVSALEAAGGEVKRCEKHLGNVNRLGWS